MRLGWLLGKKNIRSVNETEKGGETMADFSQGQLRALINQMVEQAVGEKLGARAASWQADRQSNYARLSYDHQPRSPESQGFNFYGTGRPLSYFGDVLSSQYNQNLLTAKEAYNFSKSWATGGELSKSLVAKRENQLKNAEKSWMGNTGRVIGGFGSALQGFGGLQSAYANKDPLSGAMSGSQVGSGIASMFTKSTSAIQNAGWIGMGLGLLIGLFGKKKEIDEWNKPKFRDAEKAYNKLFTVDRGEEDLYYMPESFYFRSGWSGPRHIVVKVGNDQFDNHIRESMTSSYATQLQRGLVF